MSNYVYSFAPFNIYYASKINLMQIIDWDGTFEIRVKHSKPYESLLQFSRCKLLPFQLPVKQSLGCLPGSNNNNNICKMYKSRREFYYFISSWRRRRIRLDAEMSQLPVCLLPSLEWDELEPTNISDIDSNFRSSDVRRVLFVGILLFSSLPIAANLLSVS